MSGFHSDFCARALCYHVDVRKCLYLIGRATEADKYTYLGVIPIELLLSRSAQDCTVRIQPFLTL